MGYNLVSIRGVRSGTWRGDVKMLNNPKSMAALLFAQQTKKYFEANPRLRQSLRRAEKTYDIFDQYLRLTQPRLILRETEGGSNAEATLSAEISRANS